MACLVSTCRIGLPPGFVPVSRYDQPRSAAHRRAAKDPGGQDGGGVGALGEVVEFAAVVAVPDTNVGGYTIAAVDLVCNLIGGLIATGWLVMTAQPVSAEVVD